MCKVILVFRFGPRLGLKTEDLGQAEQKYNTKITNVYDEKYSYFDERKKYLFIYLFLFFKKSGIQSDFYDMKYMIT